jgi:S1-C subfamily serine protease
MLENLVANEGKVIKTEDYLQPIVNFYFTNDQGQWLAIQKAVVGVVGDMKSDIAILELITGDYIPNVKKEYPFLELCTERPEVGNEVATGGFPLGDNLMEAAENADCSFHFGRISALVPYDSPKLNPTSIQLDMFTNHGNSGGPVFNQKDGKVLGMLNAGMTAGIVDVIKDGLTQRLEIPTGISYAIPALLLQNAISSFESKGKEIVDGLRNSH